MTVPRDVPIDMSAAAERMALPKYQELFAPALSYLSSVDSAAVRDVVAHVADQLGLSKAQREQRFRGGGQRRLDNRVTWALIYLERARALDRVRRGVFQITDRGRRLLRDHPGGFGVDELRQFDEFRAFLARSRAKVQVAGEPPAAITVSDSETPLEQVTAAVARLDAAVAAEILERILGQSPEFLEKAVLRLLVAIGYGGSEDAGVHLGGPGDGGFDGMINQDRLGLARVYVQAKRYAVDHIVGRSAVQAFVGALHHAGAAGGVFITTSRFSPDAEAFARLITPRVILIDGQRLGELMVSHGVGVQERQVFRVLEVDEDFFD